MINYVLRVFDSKGNWFSTKHVKDYTAEGQNIADAIQKEFAYWEPGSVSKITVEDTRGVLRTVEAPQVESTGLNLRPHKHILSRLHEASNNKLNPEYGAAERVGTGDSSNVSTLPKKEGDEFQPTGEERREVELADRILAAANRMAKTPDVEEVIRLADELKKMHGKS